MTLHLSDLRQYRSGPFWAEYQEERQRRGIAEDPDYVPAWFLYRVAMDRFDAGQSALEPFARDVATVEACKALHYLKSYVRSGPDGVGQRELLTAAILGATEDTESPAPRAFVERTTGQPYKFGGDPAEFDGRAVADRVVEIAQERGIELKRRPLHEALALALGMPADTDEAQLIIEVTALRAAGQPDFPGMR